MPEAALPPEESSTSLEAKVNLLLAMMVDERLFPGGELGDAQEMLRRIGIDLQIPADTQQTLRILQNFEDQEYFLSRRWVTRRLSRVTEQLASFESRFADISSATQEAARSISRSAEMTSRLEIQIQESLTANREVVVETKESRRTLQDMASKYALLQTTVSDIATSLKSLTTNFEKTTKDVEAINAAVAKLQ